jgi:hypothetical protein
MILACTLPLHLSKQQALTHLLLSDGGTYLFTHLSILRFIASNHFSWLAFLLYPYNLPFIFLISYYSLPLSIHSAFFLFALLIYPSLFLYFLLIINRGCVFMFVRAGSSDSGYSGGDLSLGLVEHHV